ncbi:MAG: MFS transporter [Thaumarchaeota archaeon]|nr:MFS transporter [Nitrososphaerota archaeon]
MPTTPPPYGAKVTRSKHNSIQRIPVTLYLLPILDRAKMHPETRAVSVLAIVFLFHALGRNVILPIMTPYARQLGASEAIVGAVIGVFGLGRVLFDLPIGAMVQKYGAKRIMSIGLITVLTSSILAVTAFELWVLIAARLLEGVGASLFYIAGLALLARITSPEKRGRLMSITSGMVDIGIMSGPAIGGVVAEFYGLSAPFYIYVLLSVAAIPLVVYPLREPEDAEKTGAKFNLGIFKELLVNRDLLLVNLATFAIFVSRFGVMYTGVSILAYDNLGVSKAALGGMLGLASVASFILLYPIGYLSDRFGRKPFMFMALCSSAIVVFLMPRVTDANSLAIAIVIYGAAIGVHGPTPAWFTDLAPTHARGSAMGMYRFVNDIGQALGPIMVGILIELTRTDMVQPFPFDFIVVVQLAIAVLIIKARDPRFSFQNPREQKGGIETANSYQIHESSGSLNSVQSSKSFLNRLWLQSKNHVTTATQEEANCSRKTKAP